MLAGAGTQLLPSPCTQLGPAGTVSCDVVVATCDSLFNWVQAHLLSLILLRWQE